MFKGKIIILKGGYSHERDISLKSAENVEKALEKIGYKYDSIDCVDEFINKIINSKADLCFNALHGEFGEDGQIQAILDNLNIKYTHSGVSSSVIAMNKAISKEIFIKNNIPTPDYQLIEKQKLPSLSLKPPFVIKPVNNGSSIGIYIILNESDKIRILKELEDWQYGNYVMVEKYIKGRELTCGIISDKPTEVMEIKAKNNFYDYHTKYTKGMSNHFIPAELPKNIYDDIKEMTLDCHNLLQCDGITRTDFRLEEDSNKPFVLELNTHPGLTKTSLIPELAAAQGISYTDLIGFIIEEAACRE